MKLSISNLAWTIDEEPEILSFLNTLKFKAIEIIPSRYIDFSKDNYLDQAHDFKSIFLDKNHWLISSFQALLANTNELHLFRDKNTRSNLKKHLIKVIRSAAILNVKNLVFGSPKNRIINNSNISECHKIALDFFAELGEIAASNKTILAIEPNAKEYGGDFLCTTKDTVDFLTCLNHSNIKLNMDLSTMILNHEDLKETIKYSYNLINHIHLSEPFLKPFSDYQQTHTEFAEILKGVQYDKYISIEIAAGSGRNLKIIEHAIESIINLYQ